MTQSIQNHSTGHPKLTPFEVNIQSDEFAVRDALARVLNALGPLDLDAEESGTIEIVLAEVLNNIVEHAYPTPSQSGPIAIKCAHQTDGLNVQIIDRGDAMPQGKLPLGETAPLDVDLEVMPEGGFGWFMIHHLTKDVSYARIDGENRVNLRLAIGLQA